MQRLRVLFIGLALAPGLVVAAEREPIPAGATVSVDELIARSTRIVLVSVAGKADQPLPASDAADDRIRIDLDAELRKATEAKASADDRAEPVLRIARLDVVEELHGSGPAVIYKPAAPAGEPQHDYKAHTAQRFWEDCNEGLVRFEAGGRPVMHFEPGRTYLFFEGAPHVKGAELIDAEDDAWLAYVRAQLAKPN